MTGNPLVLTTCVFYMLRPHNGKFAAIGMAANIPHRHYYTIDGMRDVNRATDNETLSPMQE